MSDTVRDDIVRSISEGARAALLERDAELAALRAIAEQLAKALETPGYVWKTPSGEYLWHERHCNSPAGDDCQRRCTSQRAALAAWKEWNREY